MTKDVLISVKGLQSANSDNRDSLEVICGGTYYFKNNKHYVLYEEVVDETTEPVKNMVVISDKRFELKKSGVVNTQMIFEEKQKHLTFYETQVGNLMIGMNTNKVQIVESEDEIRVFIQYALDINYEFDADCEIEFKICAKKSCE